MIGKGVGITTTECIIGNHRPIIQSSPKTRSPLERIRIIALA